MRDKSAERHALGPNRLREVAVRPLCTPSFLAATAWATIRAALGCTVFALSTLAAHMPRQ